MSENLSDYRKSYEKNTLSLKNTEVNPFNQFKNWFKEAENSAGVEEVNAMSVASLGTDGFPKSRVVLLKQYDEEGFYFYTNYDSEKGKAIAAHPQLCLSFFWPHLERQIIIKGVAQRLAEEQSRDYFNSRPRGSQLGALVSPQSKVIPDREYLEERLAGLQQEYSDKDIPKPENWGGFKVVPQEFEFWQGRPNRLHDRIRYKKNNIEWQRERLAP